MRRFGMYVLCAFVVATCLVLAAGCSFAAGTNQTEMKEDAANNTNEIKLTISNYDYYLTINDTVTSRRTYAQGTVEISSHEVVIYGAVSGLYQDCVLYYKVGEDGKEQEVKLNAAGYASFEYSSSGKHRLVFVRATGTIVR